MVHMLMRAKGEWLPPTGGATADAYQSTRTGSSAVILKAGMISDKSEIILGITSSNIVSQ